MPQAACGQSVTRHSLPEDAFKIPTCSVVISPASARCGRYSTSTHLAGNGKTKALLTLPSIDHRSILLLYYLVALAHFLMKMSYVAKLHR